MGHQGKIHGLAATALAIAGMIATAATVPAAESPAPDARLRLPAAAERGAALFFSKAGCVECHATEYVGAASPEREDGVRFQLVNQADLGLFELPKRHDSPHPAASRSDAHPPSLNDVLDHYTARGSTPPDTEMRLEPMGLTDQEMNDLKAFLDALGESSPSADPGAPATSP